MIERRRIYAGEVLTTAPLESIKAWAGVLWQRLRESFPQPRQAHQKFSVDQIRQRVKQIEQSTRPQLEEVLTELGLAVDEYVYHHPPRLRAILPGSEQVEAAAPVFYAHRDTWYANPAGQINGWFALHPVSESETFHFYPSAFASSVDNDSHRFDYDNWVGFGSLATTTATYPRALSAPTTVQGFSLEPGQVLFFSAAHLHQTRPQTHSLIRYSVDFRLLHLGDEALGLAAPDLDNRSRGSTRNEFVSP